MEFSKLNKKQIELLYKLSALIKEYGFTEVLYLLEHISSNNAVLNTKPWESIRKNLEDSIIEIEEWNISDCLN